MTSPGPVGPTNEVMTKGIQIMLCLDFLCYMCLGGDHGPVAQPSLAMGTDEPLRVLLQKCVPKRHRWIQAIQFIPVICLCKALIARNCWDMQL